MPRRRDAAAGALPLRHALALGLLHGPAELLPVSSSAHTELVPWLARWPYVDLDPELRKAFEVALHAGTAAALLIGLRDEVAAAARGLDRRRAMLILGSFVPPAFVGYRWSARSSERLGTPATIAAGLLAGSLAMAAADALRAAAPRARGRRPASTRSRSASPRRARWCPASRATARRWPPRAPAASTAHDANGALAPRRAAGHRRRHRR